MLVPTRVGMIPVSDSKHTEKVSCPHTRGDDPVTSESLQDFSDACPHTRGDDPGEIEDTSVVLTLSPHAWG